MRRAGVDIVVLLDGSASMHVRDVTGNRWQRSIRFLRVLGDSLSWDEDRIALTLFAHIAAPQVRLTRDPNTFFFFLDHLADSPPFRLEDDTSWDTNIALGIDWGLRAHREGRGAARQVAERQAVRAAHRRAGVDRRRRGVAEADARARHPGFVVGVGTLQGGLIPDPKRVGQSRATVIRSALDRALAQRDCRDSGGRYLELDRDSDVRDREPDHRRRPAARVATQPEPTMQPLYWPFLFAAACRRRGRRALPARPLRALDPGRSAAASSWPP